MKMVVPRRKSVGCALTGPRLRARDVCASCGQMVDVVVATRWMKLRAAGAAVDNSADGVREVRARGERV